MLFSPQAYAGLVIDITDGVEGSLPIAIVPFKEITADNPAVKSIRTPDIASIIKANLRRTGQFNPLATNELPEKPGIDDIVKFQRWKGAGVENMVVGEIKQLTSQRFQVTFKLFDVYTKQQILAYMYKAKFKNLRSVAHKITDKIYEKLTGVRGDFDTRLTYIVAKNSLKNKKKKIYSLMVSESDGFNEQVVLRSGRPIMSPSWSPNGKRLAYVSFEKGRSTIYIQELRTGQRKLVSSFRGINSAPRWSPDGKKLAVSLSKDGNAEVYILYLDSGVLQRITKHYAIDTEPAWSPDGTSLGFTSDRGGKPQIYEVAIGPKGKNGSPKRITFEGKYNTRVDYSPDGQFLTYITIENGSFRVALMDRKTGSVSILTQSRLDESPSFSPNGMSVIYATELRGKGVLEVVPVNSGMSPHRLRVSYGDVREPSWSGFK
ncbi:MAG: Tol-Pal system beta propeller repeat protein TolB [Gammaproteobacteria bacterium]|nr:Tol-Pal system beta propeller repeat protein TolB [Gammaproteobacteria bacterium]